jgi:hypothetical protein
MICSALDQKTQEIALCQELFFENEQNLSLVQIKIPSFLAQAGCFHRSYRACWLITQWDINIIKHLFDFFSRFRFLFVFCSSRI